MRTLILLALLAATDAYSFSSSTRFSIPTIRIPTYRIPTIRIPTVRFTIPPVRYTRAPIRIPTFRYTLAPIRIPTFRYTIPPVRIPTLRIPTIRYTIPPLRIPTIRIPTIRLPTLPPKPTCTRPNEILKSCGTPCQNYCGKKVSLCIKMCKLNQCECKPGYVRLTSSPTSLCVAASRCPTAKPTPKPTPKPTAKPTPKPCPVVKCIAPKAPCTRKPSTLKNIITKCPIFPCGILSCPRPTPKPTAKPTPRPCPVVKCIAPKAPCTRKPSDLKNIITKCPIFPCGILSCPRPTLKPTVKPTAKPCPVPKCLPAKAPCTRKPSTLKNIITKCPIFPCGILSCPRPTIKPTAKPTPRPTKPTTCGFMPRTYGWLNNAWNKFTTKDGEKEVGSTTVKGDLKTCISKCQATENCRAFSRPFLAKAESVAECWLKVFKDAIPSKGTYGAGSSSNFWGTYVVGGCPRPRPTPKPTPKPTIAPLSWGPCKLLRKIGCAVQVSPNSKPFCDHDRKNSEYGACLKYPSITKGAKTMWCGPKPTPKPTTVAPTPKPTEAAKFACYDVEKTKKCERKAAAGKCEGKKWSKACPKSCGICEEFCVNKASDEKCAKMVKKGRCEEEKWAKKCVKSCQCKEL